LIAMSTTAGVTWFQWSTQAEDRRYQSQVQALAEFAGVVSSATSAQASNWHLANRSRNLSAWARRLAARDLTKPDAIADYKELLKVAWELESESTAAYQEASHKSTTTAAAYAKVLVAFNRAEKLEMPLLGDLEPWPLMSGAPNADELRAMAAYLDGSTQKLSAAIGEVATQQRAWYDRLDEFKKSVGR
jgi:hypothetical protein